MERSKEIVHPKIYTCPFTTDIWEVQRSLIGCQNYYNQELMIAAHRNDTQRWGSLQS